MNLNQLKQFLISLNELRSNVFIMSQIALNLQIFHVVESMSASAATHQPQSAWLRCANHSLHGYAVSTTVCMATLCMHACFLLCIISIVCVCHAYEGATHVFLVFSFFYTQLCILMVCVHQHISMN